MNRDSHKGLLKALRETAREHAFVADRLMPIAA
jgi:hypothetical protein